MRQFFASDLHLGSHPDGDRAVRSLAAFVCGESAPDDVLVIAGDIAVDDAGFDRCLRLFEGFRGARFAVRGNHDLWTAPGDDSVSRYRRLGALIRRAGFHPLDDEPARIGDTGYVGSIGWYDYSFRDEVLGIPRSAYAAKTYPGETRPAWGDAVHVRWPYTDAQVTQMFLERLQRQLDAVRNASEVIVAIHHVPTKRLLFHPRWMVPRRWRFANAFLGSERFARLIARHPAPVRLVVNGHIHRGWEVRDGEVTYASIGGDYLRKELLIVEGARIERMSFEGQNAT